MGGNRSYGFKSLVFGSFRELIVFFALFAVSATAWSAQVNVAGFAFAGDYGAAAARFPYTYKIFEAQRTAQKTLSPFSVAINGRAVGIQNVDYKFTADSRSALKNSDQALMSVLVLTGETVSVEQFGSYYKTFVSLRGDALIFDYKSQTIVRSCPLSVVLFDASPTKPAEGSIAGFVIDLLNREDGRGLVTQYVRCLERATVPREGALKVQVRTGDVSPEALALMPESLRKNPSTANAMLADALASILSSKLGISMLPTSIGHAGHEMTMRLDSGDDVKLKLEEGDFVFDVKLNKLVKIKTAENNISTAFVYGAYMSMRFSEPGLGTQFIETDLKNGENAVVPLDKLNGDDFSAYQDAIRGLFLKFADAIQKPESKWITTSASVKNIDAQMELARITLRKCK